MRLSVAASDDKNQKVLELAKKQFEEKHPGVEIEIVTLPREIIERSIREGSAPDLLDWDGSNIGDLLDRGIILDLTSLMDNSAFDVLDFYPSALNAASDKGRIGAIPVMAEVPGVFYNKALFDEAGVAYPKDNWTWDEFVRKAQMLNSYDADGEVVRYGAYLVPRLLPVEPLVWSRGGAFLSEDGEKASGYLDSPETAETIRRYLEMYHPLEVTPFEDVGAETWVACFIHHKMAMYYDASWAIKPMAREHREQFGVVMPPRMGEEPLRNIVQVYGYCISAQCQNVPLAWTFLQELTSPHTEAGREWAKHNLAVSRTVAGVSGQQADSLYQPFLASLENARLGAFDVSSLRLWDYWNNDIFQEWVLRESRINVEERLRIIAREYDDHQ
ncbi:sugar ABC transporter substrate-binding protein [Paenibacillus sp. PR3]|uniref:Sugar ABC transporter substrate-binding protein n=1 Tax=Paenibacillus terricola TaxID=2763503 RepID=A0ABR8MW91_9BACL|nr:sugar ABC transporter substrate-binding protein [Paenibacillus terricola]MBD3918424.1 sugar ABC transporter substrate-binding protein [Paenibacillus terricola]